MAKILKEQGPKLVSDKINNVNINKDPQAFLANTFRENIKYIPTKDNGICLVLESEEKEPEKVKVINFRSVLTFWDDAITEEIKIIEAAKRSVYSNIARMIANKKKEFSSEKLENDLKDISSIFDV